MVFVPPIFGVALWFFMLFSEGNWTSTVKQIEARKPRRVGVLIPKSVGPAGLGS